MKRLVLVLCLSSAVSAAQDPPDGPEPLEPVTPDALLTVPHILKTPVIHDFALAPDDSGVALSLSVLGKETLWMIPDDETVGSPIASSRGLGERDVDWSPDGERIAFAASRGTRWHIYMSDPAGENARRLTRHTGLDRKPRWSPDGTQIAFLSTRPETETGWDLWLTTLPEGRQRQLSRHPFDEDDHRWSPDGKRIAFTYRSGRHVNRRIGIIPIDGSSHEFLDPLPEEWQGDSYGARWSGDGQELIFVSDEGGRKALYRVPAGRGEPTLLIDSPHELTEPALSPDGTKLAYLENRDGNVRLKLHDLETEEDRTLTLRAGVHTHPVWRQDGSTVVALYEAWNYPRDVWAYPIEGGRERVSDTLPADLDVRRLARPELIRFEAPDGQEITGFLYLPEAASAEEPVPALVRPHGGPTSQWKNGWHPFAQLLIQQGYAVFAPNVRGSTGYGVSFESLNNAAWGQSDLDDLIAGARLVVERPEILDDRVGIWGVSYGGFLTLAAITRYPDFFACAVEAIGMPDLEKLYRQTNTEGRTYLDRELGPLRGNLERYRSLSPLTGVENVETPLLSFHGELYPLVPYETKRAFFDALRRRPGYPLTELIFKGDEARGTYRHDLHPGASWAYVEKILEFLGIYL